MPATQIPARSASLTADADATGLVTIASTDGWIAGALVWLVDDVTAAVECKIVEIVSGSTMRLRKLSQNAKMPGAFSDLSAYALADNAKIAMEQQVVTVVAPFTSRGVA